LLGTEVFGPEGDDPLFRLARQLVVESCRLARFQEAFGRLPALHRQDNYHQVLALQFHLIRSQLGAGQPAELQEGLRLSQGASLPIIAPDTRREVRLKTPYGAAILLSLDSPSS
jgi:hypothetical protein